MPWTSTWRIHRPTLCRDDLPPRNTLFMVPVDEDGQRRRDAEILVYGHILEKAIWRFGGTDMLQKKHTPLQCHLGEERTTPQKKKHRLAELAGKVPAIPIAPVVPSAVPISPVILGPRSNRLPPSRTCRTEHPQDSLK